MSNKTEKRNKKVTIYQMLTEIQLNKFLKFKFNKTINDIEITELKEDLLYGDFLIIGGYKFKKVYSSYQCLETPTQKSEPNKIMFTKAPNDILKK